MIRVHTVEGTRDFAAASRFCTDEHNNLSVMAGPRECPAGCFAAGFWVWVEVIDA